MRPWYRGKYNSSPLLPSVAIHRVETVGVKLDSGPEEMGVGSHVEQPLHVPHLPYLFLPITGAIHQHRMAFVNPSRDFCVPARAEDRRGASIGVDAGEVGRGQGKAAIRVVDGSGVVQEEGAFGFVEMALLSAEDERRRI